MAANDFDVELFERRLHTLKDSQESIQSLSAWCLERRQHHKKIVATWLQVLKKVKVEHRLTLFYLANDVIQYSKRKNFEFVESWGITLQRATTMVRDEKVKHRILRIFKIWDQRQVYDEEFLADLSGLISAAPKKKQDPQPVVPTEEFQAALLISTMRSCATLEQATDARLRDLRECNIDFDNAEELCASLKDRRHVEDAEKDVDIAVRNVENYVRALEAEIRERTQVLELLEQADQFYETQRGEVKIVTNAYRNFGSRVKNLKKKLDELLPTLISPIPSPDINAPSPSPDSDLDLPGDDHIGNQSLIDIAPPTIYGSYRPDYDPMPVPAPDGQSGSVTGDFTNNFSSFMGGNMDFDMRNLFNDRSTTPTILNQYNDSLEAKPIEVINMRPSKAENSNDSFNISSFLKTVLPSSEGAPNPSGIPGLGLDLPDNNLESPQRPDYGHSPVMGQVPLTPAMNRMLSGPGTPIGGLNNCGQIGHSTPLPVRSITRDSHTPSPYSSQNSQSNVVLPFDNSVNPVSNTVNPLPPPPLPPPIFLDDENCYNKLPPKFPTWTPTSDLSKDPAKWDEKGKNSMNPSWPGEIEERNKSLWGDSGNDRWESGSESAWSVARGKSDILSETPESPPMYEKSGFQDPVEYNDTQPQESLLSSSSDVDHRMIPLPMSVESQLSHRLAKAADVDHRNLISLTGSPANHHQLPIQSVNAPLMPALPNNAGMWPTGDQDYRQQLQPGDIVESVDMEMSDDEGENKQKSRVLVDVRPQDRDVRPPQQPPGTHHVDMDMRAIPLPMGQLGPNPQMDQGPHQTPPQFHKGRNPDFQANQPDFRRSVGEPFRPNFRKGQGPGFGKNQQEFHQGSQQDFQQEFQQDFHQGRQSEFRQEFHENQHGRRSVPDFHGDKFPHGRFQQQEHHHRDSPMFHRGDRGGGRGRGFRNRRDRFSEDHGNSMQHRNLADERRNTRFPDGPSKSRPYLLEPPDTVVVLDDDGMPIGLPEDEGRLASDQLEDVLREEHVHENRSTVEEPSLVQGREPDPDAPSRPFEEILCQREMQEPDRDPDREPAIPEDHRDDAPLLSMPCQEEVVPEQPEECPQEALRDAHEEEEERRNEEEPAPPGEGRPARVDSQEEISPEGREIMEPHDPDPGTTQPPRQLSEQLQAMMNSNGGDRQSANGSLAELREATPSPLKKRPFLGSFLPGPGPGANGPQELHPAVVYEYDGPNATPTFRPRGLPTAPFPPWRGPHRGRAGFRGGPRAPWDRGPRGPVGTFHPRGLKRGGQFRGGGFRGRGRGTNW
ncbi:uncharacterized protein LOC105697431 isoform X2 [Orussus abietinus]|uniref:uncharacterized protein LOC105697431 isoform X2 n=1 Tax=Orussus abietinus TaxID=222816 RepID=UPI0006253A1F|nr:uncharacterized protein LOC105697431 isoform X2 [Orussus abietinus]